MRISSNKQIPKIYYDLVWCLSSCYFMAHLTQHTSIVLYHTNFPHQISAMDFSFPVSCINCNDKQLKCKASSHSKGSCHHCLLNGIECFFPVAAVAASATVSPGVGVYSFQRNCFHCTQSHRQCQPPLPVTMLTMHQARASHIISIIVTRTT
jgi:hypothetical protein